VIIAELTLQLVELAKSSVSRAMYVYGENSFQASVLALLVGEFLGEVSQLDAAMAFLEFAVTHLQPVVGSCEEVELEKDCASESDRTSRMCGAKHSLGWTTGMAISDWAMASTLYSEAYEGRTELFGNDHKDTLSTGRRLGWSLVQKHRGDGDIQSLERAIEILRQVSTASRCLKIQEGSIIQADRCLAEALHAHGSFDEARKFMMMWSCAATTVLGSTTVVLLWRLMDLRW